jgi:hypothetical protein
MDRINGQKPGFQLLALKVLSWITCAKRPLTTTEMQEALAIQDDDAELDLDNIPEIEDMISVCAGLVTVDKESKIIRLVHYTAQEYFEQTQKRWFPDAEVDIAKACVSYLLFDTFDRGFCSSDGEFEALLQKHMLYSYAAQNWGDHARSASVPSKPFLISLLESEAKLSICSQAIIASQQYYLRSNYKKCPTLIRGAHIAAYFGLEEAVGTLLQRSHDPDSKDSYNRTPLWWAAHNGHDAVVKRLLANVIVDKNSRDDMGQTPLSRAAEKGHGAVVRILLAEKGIDAALKDNHVRLLYYGLLGMATRPSSSFYLRKAWMLIRKKI